MDEKAFASLNYLIPYVDAIHDKAEEFDVPTPVVDALRDMLTSTSPFPSLPLPLHSPSPSYPLTKQTNN